MKGCIFDIDGTMFLNREYHMLAWKQCLRGPYERPFTEDEFAEHMFGPTNENIIHWLFNGRLSPEESLALSLKKESAYRDACRDSGSAHLTNGLPLFLDRLKALNCSLGIATGAPIENLQFYWQLFSLGKWFDFSKAVYDDGRLPGKPAPAIYCEAARRIGRTGSDCCVFEDAVPGLQSALGAGIGTIVMIDSTLDKDTLSSIPGVSYVIHDFSDADGLIKLLEM